MTTAINKPTRFRELEVGGSPREMGRQLGEAAREEVQTYVDLVVERFNVGRTARVNPRAALDVAAESIPYAERYLPGAMEERRGIAEGAGITLEQAMLINVRNQLGAIAPPEGCTSVLIGARASATGNGLVGQNW